MPKIAKAKKVVKSKKVLKFTVDCSQPVDDGIMDAASFVSRAPRTASVGKLAWHRRRATT